MKKRRTRGLKGICLFALIWCSFVAYGQRIKQDIFDDLVYKEKQYEAQLKKNIFEGLTFSDSNQNKIKFSKEFLERCLGDKYDELPVKSMFFQDLILDYIHINGYEATYEMDIFDALIMKDNQGKEVKISEDIFGNLNMKTKDKDQYASISMALSGDLEYQSAKQTAALTTDFYGNKVYSDSNKTKISMAKNVWEQFLKRHKTERAVFIYLMEQFLFGTK